MYILEISVMANTLVSEIVRSSNPSRAIMFTFGLGKV